MKHQITTNGIIVWINSDQGMCIGRFRHDVMDVHHDAAAQMAFGRQCIDCAHENVTWANFKAAMLKHHGVDVPDKFKPKNAR